MKNRRALLGAVILLAIALLPAPARAADGKVRLVVWKKLHLLQLLRGEKVLRTYRISLGVAPQGPKELRGDGRTPVGVYTVYEKRPSERFHRFLALSYPDSSDADRAFDAGLISADTWADIWLASKRGEKPPYNTPLGGFVGIHGTGSSGRKAELRRVVDWTDGCIALSDRDIAELYGLVPVGSPVEIQE
jgi:murein L,D-transpeptidase YafK